ncbi:peptide-binding protein [Effusibacillus pohliae]|uniref:peptide-binding protein n=1 Tax=Effusibacillus pohliae TaxID=232270 RepID=UPI0003624303|nr:peptide-binding protein [Effusibacillus pohliae]
MEMSRKWFWTAVSAALAASVALAGCSKDTAAPQANTTKEKVDGGEIIWGGAGEPSILNPFWATDVVSSNIYDLILEPLYTVNPKLQPEPVLADGMPQISSDNLEWMVKIRKNVKFSDGQPLTADDVVFTFSIPIDKDYAGPRKSTFEKLKKVEKVDDYTVKFTLSEPYAPFLTGALGYEILPKHILKDVPIKEMDKAPFTKNPIGTGPYKLAEWKSGQYVKLERNENYFAGKPAIKTITYKIVPEANALIAQLQAGEVNRALISNPADLQALKPLIDAKKFKVAEDIGFSYTYVGWNEMNDLFKDKKVRQALTMAIDRKAIVDSVLEGHGKVANAPQSPLSWAYNDNVTVFEYDPEKAKKLLEEAGWKDTNGDGILDKDGKKFTFELMTNQGNKAREQIVTIIQQQLKKVGIEVTPRIIEFSSLVNNHIKQKKFDAYVLGWALATDPDPTSIWHSREIAKGLNYVSYSNPEVDRLSDENTKVLDQTKRKELIGKAYKLISEDQPYTFLYYPNKIDVVPYNLEGYEFHPRLDFYNMHKWYFTK